MTDETISALRTAINQAYLANENDYVVELLASMGAYNSETVSDCAKTLVNAVREKKDQQSPISALFLWALLKPYCVFLTGLPKTFFYRKN
jgi:hypothetical protein